ncbi:MAG: TMEM43 family protein [Planctomycetia bacterium]|nr:TMEM43 family protein [Planctomycetia bacterium]
MAYTETTNQSYFSRIGNAFKGIIAGIALVIAAVVLLFWNEGRTVKRYKALKEGNAAVVNADAAKVDPANEGKLVYLTGKALTGEILKDDDFGVSVNAIKLRREVDMYQWIENSTSETKKKMGGGTETVTKYTYAKNWSPSVIDSSSFKESGHANPGAMAYQSTEYYASEVILGAFKLSNSLKNSIGPEEKYNVANQKKEKSVVKEPEKADPAKETPAAEKSTTVPEKKKSDVPAAPKTDKAKENPIKSVSYLAESDSLPASVPAALADKKESVKEYNGGFYIGRDPNSPEIGDLRIVYSVIYPGKEISVVSQQKGNTFIPYQTKNGSVELLQNGTVSADDMFKAAQSENKMMGWILRVIGVVVMFIGFNCVLKPLSVLADVVPFIGSIVGTGSAVFSFLISMAISLGTISIAWFYYRPLFGIPIFVVGLLFVFLAFRRKPAVKKQ